MLAIPRLAIVIVQKANGTGGKSIYDGNCTYLSAIFHVCSADERYIDANNFSLCNAFLVT